MPHKRGGLMGASPRKAIVPSLGGEARISRQVWGRLKKPSHQFHDRFTTLAPGCDRACRRVGQTAPRRRRKKQRSRCREICRGDGMETWLEGKAARSSAET